jgi:hypothetical protein
MLHQAAVHEEHLCGAVMRAAPGSHSCMLLTLRMRRTWITSAFALATPDATVPMPASPTSFTLTLAEGAIMWRS